jgi:sarcosine oxidase subunit beta
VTTVPSSADVVVVGGGVIGAACLHALALLGVRGCLVERLGLAAGASSACQSGIGYGLGMDDSQTRFHRLAVDAYRDFAADGADVDYVRHGGIVIGEPGDHGPLQRAVSPLRAAGFEAEWLDRPALRELEPELSPEVDGAVHLADMATVSPMKVVGELVQRSARLSAQTVVETELQGIEVSGDRVTAALTNRGRIATPWLVIAAGAWSRDVGALAGLAIPVWPLKGHVIVTEPLQGFVRHYLSENRYEATVQAMRSVAIGPDGPRIDGIAHVASVIQPLPSGSLLIGSSREFAGFDRDVNRRRIGDLAGRAQRLVPRLAHARVLRTYAGLRPWCTDGKPLIGRTRALAGLALATGHAGDGNTGALITGRLLAADIAGQASPLDLSLYSPDRFDLRMSGDARSADDDTQERQ